MGGGNLPSQLRYQIQTGRTAGVASPFWESGKDCRTGIAEHLDSGQKQSAICSHQHGGLTRHGMGVAYLGLSDSKCVFDFAMVDFDLPAVEVRL